MQSFSFSEVSPVVRASSYMVAGTEKCCKKTRFAYALSGVVILPEKTAKSKRVVNLSFTNKFLANDIERVQS